MAYDATRIPPVGSEELASLEAMVLHVAEASKKPPFHIERQVADHFAVPNIKRLPVSVYDSALRFMMDMVPEIQAV